jgi:hypothetical protein
MRTRQQPIRTFSQIPVQVKIPCHQALPVYQVLASKIKELKALGLSNNNIASRLKVHKTTVVKGLIFQN